MSFQNFTDCHHLMHDRFSGHAAALQGGCSGQPNIAQLWYIQYAVRTAGGPLYLSGTKSSVPCLTHTCLLVDPAGAELWAGQHAESTFAHNKSKMQTLEEQHPLRMRAKAALSSKRVLPPWRHCCCPSVSGVCMQFPDAPCLDQESQNPASAACFNTVPAQKAIGTQLPLQCCSFL